MSRTLEEEKITQGGEIQGRTKARRQAMPTALDQLEPRIIEILSQAKGQPLSIPDIERKLADAGMQFINTFDVRDAVWHMVAHKKAEFTHWLAVKLPKT